MEQQNKNKYTEYILVTVAYIFAVIFILQDQQTDVGNRIAIVYFYLVSLLGVFAYKYLKKNN